MKHFLTAHHERRAILSAAPDARFDSFRTIWPAILVDSRKMRQFRAIYLANMVSDQKNSLRKSSGHGMIYGTAGISPLNSAVVSRVPVAEKCMEVTTFVIGRRLEDFVYV